MKKIVSLLLVSCLAISCFVGCSAPPTPTEEPLELPIATQPVEIPPTTTPTEPEIEEPVEPTVPDVELSSSVGFEAWHDGWFVDGIGDTDEDVLVSPLSLKMACLLAAAGAEGETQTQLLNMFGYETLDEFLAWGEYILGIQNALDPDAELGTEDGGVDEEGNFIGMNWGNMPGSSFKIANGIWHNTGEPGEFTAIYKERVARLNAAIDSLPGDELKDAINNWANEATNGLIPEVVGDDVAEQNNILANALYLKAAWMNEFYGDFVEEDFKTKSGEIVQKTMMTQEVRLRYYKDDKCSFVILPLSDGFYMTVIKGDTENIANKMESAESTLINLKLPKFEITHKAQNLKEMMANMGVVDAFDSNVANFKGMMDVDTFISQITQDSKIVVDEKGIEAAAVTVIHMATSGLITDPPKPVDFFVDEAFTFYIYHDSYDNSDALHRELLFYGQCNE